MAAVTENSKTIKINFFSGTIRYTVELQWLEHPRDYKNMFDTGEVRANECL